MNKTSYRRGDIVMVNLPIHENVQGGKRCCVVIQNDRGNLYSSNLVVCPITSKLDKSKMPTHVFIDNCVLELPSMVMCETILTISKNDIEFAVGTFDDYEMGKINKAIMIELDLCR